MIWPYLPVVSTILIYVAGFSMGIPGVKPPTIDVAAATKDVLSALDANGDGSITKDEAKSSYSGIADS